MLQKKSKMTSLQYSDYPNVQFGEQVEIFGNNVIIRPGVKIGDRVKIYAENIEIGYDTSIEQDVVFKGIGGQTMQNLIIGDNCLIGFRNQILVPEFILKDYSQLHNSCLCSGYKPIHIGYNCWIGQGAILNSFESLTLCNNVRMGGSQIWTHVASGEVLEGSNFFGSNPVTLEDDVWLMGFGHLITPGVTLKKGSVIMAGTTITKDTEPYHTYSGIPAKNISDKLPAWTKKTVQDKFSMLKQFVDEFIDSNPIYASAIQFVAETSLQPISFFDTLNSISAPQIFIFETVNLAEVKNVKHTLFDLTTKTYLKRRTKLEIDFIKFNLGYRARFIPFIEN